jgi:hypothetical protein
MRECLQGWQEWIRLAPNLAVIQQPDWTEAASLGSTRSADAALLPGFNLQTSGFWKWRGARLHFHLFAVSLSLTFHDLLIITFHSPLYALHTRSQSFLFRSVDCHFVICTPFSSFSVSNIIYLSLLGASCQTSDPPCLNVIHLRPILLNSSLRFQATYI